MSPDKRMSKVTQLLNDLIEMEKQDLSLCQRYLVKGQKRSKPSSKKSLPKRRSFRSALRSAIQST